MREPFLELLGLPRNASDDDIKKRYRELVLKLHPDVNDSPNAAEQFRLVQKAYEFLTNEDRQMDLMYQQYKKRKSPSDESFDEQAEEDKRRQMKERAKHYSKLAHEEAREIEESVFRMLTQKTPWFIVRAFAVVAVVFGLIMVVDFFVPTKLNMKRVANKVHYEYFEKNTIIFIDDSKVDVPERVFINVEPVDSLGLEYSSIFREFLGFRVGRRNGNVSYFEENANFFRFFPLFPLLFFLPGVLFFYKENAVKFYLLYFVTLVAYPGLMLHYVLREHKLEYVIAYLGSLF